MNILEVAFGGPATSDKVNEIIAAVNAAADHESGTYTPTLTGMAIGTGGSAFNSARYTYVGGPEVGDHGILNVAGRITFGTSGQTFPTSPTIRLPAGFNISNVVPTSRPIGKVRMVDVSVPTVALGAVAVNTEVDRVFPYIWGAAATYVNEAGIGPTLPWTWASSDRMEYDYTVGVVRV